MEKSDQVNAYENLSMKSLLHRNSGDIASAKHVEKKMDALVEKMGKKDLEAIKGMHNEFKEELKKKGRY